MELPIIIQWSPQFAPHVQGWYEQRQYDQETGLPETQRWGAECQVCGNKWQGACDSGQVRKHIQRFAVQHLHRDPLGK